MMTDAEIATALQSASEIEAAARRALASSADADRESVNDVLRHATATRRSIEGWIGRRARRAQLARS